MRVCIFLFAYAYAKKKKKYTVFFFLYTAFVTAGGVQMWESNTS